MYDVFTPLGKGKVVYTMPDGSLVVQFDHGGGKIFLPEELLVSRSRGGQHRKESDERMTRKGNLAPV